jgi:hypothetical protein
MLPNASNAVAATGDIVANTIVLLGCFVNVRLAAPPGSTVTVAVGVTAMVPLTVAVTVFVPATVELSVPVISPFASVVPTGCVSAFPVVGVAASVTVAPLTRFPPASLTVMVIVEALEPVLAVIDPGAAATSDWLALGAPAVPVAVKVTGLPVRPVDVAVRVFAPAVVPSVQDVTAAIPPALVVAGVVGLTVPPPDATAKVTATPATGLLNWSRTITEGGVATAVPTGVV